MGPRRRIAACTLLLALSACGQGPASVAAHSAEPGTPSAAAGSTAAERPSSAPTPATASDRPSTPSTGTSSPASSPVTATPAVASFPPCPSPPPRHAALFSYDASGHLRWRLPVPVEGDDSNPVGPVRENGVEFVAVGRVLHAVRIADGRELWTYPYGDDAYGVWLGGGTVSLLVGQVSTHAELVGLDPATGATRWTVAIPGRGLFANQVQTADDGLAWIREDGSLQVVDLTTGRIRWSHRLGLSPGLGTKGNTVVFTHPGSLLGYDSLTGTLRWTATVGAANTELTMEGDLAILWPNSDSAGGPSPDVAVDVTTGHVVWSFDRKEFAAPVGSGGGLVLFATYFDRRLYAVDARTGVLRWQATTFVAQDSTAVVAGSDVLLVEGGVPDLPGSRVVDRSLADGHIRWQHTVSGGPVLPRPITVVGDEAVVQLFPSTGSQPSPLTAYALADGSRRWSVAVPALVGRPPLADTSGTLVATEDPVYGCAA